jgi:hypothetical protein
MRPNRHELVATCLPLTALLACLALFLAILAGCGSDEQSDDPQEISGHYPLELGTTRTYRVRNSGFILYDDDPDTVHLASGTSIVTQEIVRRVTHGGIAYVVERVTHPPLRTGDPEEVFERHLREDLTGLYGSPWATEDPESTLEYRYLAYPLVPAGQWLVHRNPDTFSNSPRRETVRVPAGRFESWLVVFGPDYVPARNTFYYEWFGAPGMIRSRSQLETRESIRYTRLTVEWELLSYEPGEASNP